MNAEERLAKIEELTILIDYLIEEKNKACEVIKDKEQAFKKECRKELDHVHADFDRRIRSLRDKRKPLIQTERSMEWTAKNMDKHKEYNRKYIENNPGKAAQWSRERWERIKQDPEKHEEYKRKQREKKRENNGTTSLEQKTDGTGIHEEGS